MPSAHHLPRRVDVARALRQSAADQHQAFGAERGRLVDRALVVVDRGLPARRIGCGKHAAAAIAGDPHAVVP